MIHLLIRLIVCISCFVDSTSGLETEPEVVCDSREAEQAIKDLHDDLDDDDDGTISTKENNAFNDEYGISAGSISALIDDSDGKVSPEEFLRSWKSSVVYSWSVDDVIEWLKSPDLKLKNNAIEDLSNKFRAYNISGKCFPLMAKNDQIILKQISVRQHLVRRKLMLKSMDAILFGPPIYDTTIKDFALILATFVSVVAIIFVINLKRENANFERRLAEEHDRIARLDSRWADFNDGNNTPNGDNDSQSTVPDFQDAERVLDGAQFKIMKRENDQLRKSLDEAHREIRSLQSGNTSYEHVHITSELKTLLRRCYEYECQGLKYRKEDALKIRNQAQDAYKHLQRANQSIFASVRMIHSPTQLTSMDQSIREAQQALETVSTWQRDFSSRWKDLEKLFKVSFRIRQVYQESRNSPHSASLGDRISDQGSITTAIRLPDDVSSNTPPQSHRSENVRYRGQISMESSATSSKATNRSTSGTDKNQNGFAGSATGLQLNSNSIETTSMSSSGSHILHRTKPSASLIKGLRRMLPIRSSKREKKKEKSLPRK